MEEKILALKAQFDLLMSTVEAEKQASYDKGVIDGKASMGPTGTPSDKLYSQVEMDEKINPLNEKIVGLESNVSSLGEQIASLQAEIEKLKGDIQPQLDSAKLAAVEAFKAELLADYTAKQVVEATAETGFASKLAPSTPVEPVPSV